MALLSPLALSTQNSPPQNSLLNKTWMQPSVALRAATRIHIQNKRRSPPHLPIVCSVRGNPPYDATTAFKPEPSALQPADIDVKRSLFPRPPEFVFGAASSAYQVEGAVDEDGRGRSIWDTFTENNIDKIKDKTDGGIATDSYRRYQEDIQLMKEMGLESYRFSISWPRILPDGTLKGGVNPKGIEYYNNLINELLDNRITPFVTLFHWDVPHDLETKYDGFRSREIVKDFKDYAETCFKYFGDRVKHWTTLNEPWTFCTNGYCLGFHAPGRGNLMSLQGTEAVEPYVVAHNLILAHAAVVKTYRDHFQATQRGQMGIALNSMFYKKYSDSADDVEAEKRANEFCLGWFAHPLVYGDYPNSMTEIVDQRLPKFTDDEKKMIKGSFDFMGINYYTSFYVEHKPITKNNSTYFNDMCVDQKFENYKGESIGELQGSWIRVYPEGIYELLSHVKKTYGDFNIYITENGTCEIDDPELPIDHALNDEKRIDYIKRHLANVYRAMEEEKVKVKGYFIWALTDNFEWQSGYTHRFGLIYIDYTRGHKRILKDSATWLTKFLKP